MTLVGPAAEPELGDEAPLPAPTFDAIYEAEFDFVWRTLRRLGVRSENVADATQDVFVVLSRRWEALRSAAFARSFLYGITIRVAHEHRRAQRREQAAQHEPGEVPDERAPDAHARAVHAQEVALLDRLLAGLDAEKREVLVLVELEQLSVPEVSELTGIKLNTVYSRLRAARAAFDAALARHRAATRNTP